MEGGRDRNIERERERGLVARVGWNTVGCGGLFLMQ